VIYAAELARLQEAGGGLEIFHTFTRQQPPGWSGYARRIDGEMLAEVARPLGQEALAYVCGPTLLVEAVANGLVEIGLAPDQIRTERFGPTGSTA
jgi:ferredoxin-NADP reductase